MHNLLHNTKNAHIKTHTVDWIIPNILILFFTHKIESTTFNTWSLPRSSEIYTVYTYIYSMYIEHWVKLKIRGKEGYIKKKKKILVWIKWFGQLAHCQQQIHVTTNENYDLHEYNNMFTQVFSNMNNILSSALLDSDKSRKSVYESPEVQHISALLYSHWPVALPSMLIVL